jgi:2-deoxy-D-gluconate 3-dehydrogenase
LIGIDLSVKVAIVTGAGRGIGRAIAVALAEAGADVTLTARTASQLEETAGEVEKKGRRAIVVPGDCALPEVAAEVVKRTLAELGGLEILVNNAGMEMVKPLLECTVEDFQRVMDVNVKSMMLFTQAAGRHLIEKRYGRIVNLASTGSFVAGPGRSLYHASKAACAHFTRAVAIEWARHQITVNAVAPGWVRTDLISHLVADPAKLEKYLAAIPLRRLGEPEEIAGLVAFLCSDLAGFITGSVMVADGGLMIP